MKKMALFLFVLLPCGTALAQTEDSIFRNYLYDTRTLYFEQLPVKLGSIIFWGDSITDWGDWAELTGNSRVLNRGIAGDNTYGLLNRINEVTKNKPSKLFIMIGTNDINIGIPLHKSMENYGRIIDTLYRRTPSTQIYLQSILPINNDLIGRKYYKGTILQIQRFNNSLDSLVKSRKGNVHFLNLYPFFLDRDQQLKKSFTSDGLHLSGLGYINWIEIIKKQHLL